MSLGINKFCPYQNEKCRHCHSWEVDDVDEYGRHAISREYECTKNGECDKEVK